MSSLIFAIDPEHGYWVFGYFMLAACFFGALVYAHMRKPWLIKAAFRDLFPKQSLKFAIIASLLVAAPFAIFGYYESWGYFYKISTDGNLLKVEYLFPKRSYIIGNIEEITVTTRNVSRRTKQWYRVVLASPQHKYISQKMEIDEFNKCLESIGSFLLEHKKLD